MSYQVLARKWRPKTFETLVGQEHVVRALTHALQTGHLHHAYLFTGTRGVGKTTIARILAKSLNCETGLTPTPCGQCTACKEIDEGRFIDLLEVDAATNTRVDEMRQLLENASYAPTRGRYKVYVIDEVHMLSNAAFNAMLKTLEEPPEHIKFILATTDPQKIPVTVLSRCLQFNLKQMPPGHIIEHATRLLEAEQVPFEPAALRHIAKAAAGSMRDALSLLDQAIAHGAGKVENEGVQTMLGTVGDDYLFALLDALSQKDVAALLAIADTMQTRSLAFHTALQSLASLLQRLAVAQFAPEAISDEFERARLAPYAQTFSPEFVQMAYQIAIHGREDLALAPDDYAGFCMSLLRLAAFYPETNPGQTPPNAAALGGAAPRPKSDAAPAAILTPATPPAQAITPPAPPPQILEEVTQSLPESVPPAPPWEDAPVTTSPPVATHTSTPQDIHENWRKIVEALDISPVAREMARRCEWQAQSTPEHICLKLAPQHAHLLNPGTHEKLKTALSQHQGQTIQLEILSAPTQYSAEQLNQAERNETLAKATESLQNDPFVQGLISHFGAQILPRTIQPA